MGDLVIEYTAEELLATEPISEPLMVAGVRCHGGLAEDGRYISPRARFRLPAIDAWQESHRRLFGTEILDVPLETWPEHYPNVAQAKMLVREGVRLPMIATLTRVGTIEGFGALIRHSAVPGIQRHFFEDLAGTAVAHLDRGLLEAHARDEAGFEEEAGHRQMWYAARDVAFEHPLDPDQEHALAAGATLRGAVGPAAPVVPAMEAVLADLDEGLLALVERMVRILLIEISAFHTFAWAEAVLSDTDLVAGEGRAAHIVSCIRQDESPHVGYLRTALTEMRDRTFLGSSGRRYAGTDVIGHLWSRALEQSLGANRRANLQASLAEVREALEGNARGGSILEEFHALGSVRPEAGAGPAGPAATY